jgi:hypothetical protein
MAQQFPALSDSLAAFIAKQHIYFCGTAMTDSRVNVSPKGGDSLRVINPNCVVWQNYTGSGNETAAHLKSNNRMTLMFCSFEKKPLILRLYGHAREVHPRNSDWQQYVDLFPDNPGTRQFYVMDIDLVQTSCGFAVPFMDFKQHRDTLDVKVGEMDKDGIRQYWEDKNMTSIDGVDAGIFKDS